MNAFGALTKRLIKNTLIPNFKDEKQKKKYIAMLVGLSIGMGLPYIFSLAGMFGLVKAAVTEGYLAQVLSVGFLLSQVLTIVFGLFAYINIMYFSKDNEFLFTLPVKTVSIFWAKLIAILLYELIFSVITVIPMSIVAIIAMVSASVPVSAGFVIMILPATLLLPLMAILIIAILSYPIMKVMQFFKKRPILGAVVTILFVAAIYVAIYLPILLSGSVSTGPSGDLGSGMVESENPSEMINEIYKAILPSFSKIGQYSFHTLFLAKAMTMSGAPAFGYAMAFIGIVLALAAIGSLLAIWQYKSLSASVFENGYAEASSRKAKDVKQNSVKNALIKKEFSSILKNNTMLIQSGIMMILPPILIFFLCKMNSHAGPFVALGVAEIVLKLMTSSNVPSILAFSKDGEVAMIAKTLPVSAKDVVQSKIVVGYTFSAITIVLSTLSFAFTDGANALQVFGLFASNMFYSYAVIKFCVYRDLKNPNIHWQNIKEIVKNNFSSVIPMLVSCIPGFGIMFICIGVGFIPINRYLLSLIYVAVSALVSFLYYIIVTAVYKNKTDELYEKIE